MPLDRHISSRTLHPTAGRSAGPLWKAAPAICPQVNAQLVNGGQGSAQRLLALPGRRDPSATKNPSVVHTGPSARAFVCRFKVFRDPEKIRHRIKSFLCAPNGWLPRGGGCRRGEFCARARLLSGRSVASVGLWRGRWEAARAHLVSTLLQRTLRPMIMIAVSGTASRINSAVTTRAGSMS